MCSKTMKKLILSLAALGALTLVSCSEENKIPVIAYTGCQVCEVAGVNPERPEDYEVCVAPYTVGEGDSQTTAEVVYVNGGNTGLSPQDYFSLYCDNAYNSTGGGTTEPTNCVTCSAYTNGAGQTIPADNVCRGANGNAFVNNVDSDTPYATYLAAQVALTRTCQ